MMDKGTRVKENPATPGFFSAGEAAARHCPPPAEAPWRPEGIHLPDTVFPATASGRAAAADRRGRNSSWWGKAVLECAAPFRYVALRFNSRRWLLSSLMRPRRGG